MNKIFLAGHNGMVGRAIFNELSNKSDVKIITADRNHYDLRCKEKVDKFFIENEFDIVIIAAAKVGGIMANSQNLAYFLLDNLQIQNNLLINCFERKIPQTIFLGSSCIYPKNSTIPIKENELLSSSLEKTNEGYALAKICGLKACEYFNKEYDEADFRSLMPTNLYGKYDNFDPDSSHVLPALINKFHNAIYQDLEVVEIWGSGKPLREFLYVEDLAKAVITVMNCSKEQYQKACKDDVSWINIGSGYEITIKELAEKISTILGFKGKIKFNTSLPDGTLRKLLDSTSIRSLGWEPLIDLDVGIRDTYKWFLKNKV